MSSSSAHKQKQSPIEIFAQELRTAYDIAKDMPWLTAQDIWAEAQKSMQRRQQISEG